MEASGIVKGVSGMAGAIPIAGPIISGLGGIIGGVLEGQEAEKQKQQAEKARKDALNLKPENIDPIFQQKLRADKAAELAGLPGKLLWQNMLDQRTANDLRAIRDSSPNGAAALASASAAMGRNSQDLNTLAIKDAEFRAGQAKETRDTLWDVGLQKNRQEDIRNVRREQGLTAASALENAATYNKMNAINKILGTVGGTASAISANADANNKDAKWQQFLLELYGKGGAGKTDETSSGFSSFTDYSSGATLPNSDNAFAPINYPSQLGESNFNPNTMFATMF